MREQFIPARQAVDSLKTSNKTDKLWVHLTKRKRTKTLIIKIRDEGEDIDSKEIQVVIREDFEHL